MLNRSWCQDTGFCLLSELQINCSLVCCQWIKRLECPLRHGAIRSYHKYHERQAFQNGKMYFCNEDMNEISDPWNARLTNKRILTGYRKMRENGLQPDVSSLLAALKACSCLKDLPTGIIIHADVIDSGDIKDIAIGNTLVHMYAKCGSTSHAHLTFDRMPYHNVVSWNVVIFGYAESGEGKLALQLFARMQEECLIPNALTYVAALKACASCAASEENKHAQEKGISEWCLKKAMSIHWQLSNSRHEFDIFVENTLIDVYSKCGSMVHARLAFDRMLHHSIVSWNALIFGYAENGEGDLALQLFARMQDEFFFPSTRTYVAALKACAACATDEEGKQVDGKVIKVTILERGIAVHSQLAKTRYILDIFVASTLVDMYAKCGNMVLSHQVFDSMPYHNMVSWNAVIFGYAENGQGMLALLLFSRMQDEGFVPVALSYVAVLKACGSLAALEIGKRIHDQICFARLQDDALVANCLIGFYGKCGNMSDAKQIFDSMRTRDLVAWNALLAGYAYQGDTKHVFSLFYLMQQECFQADSITFLSILTACSHAGLIDKGKGYFRVMCLQYNISPSIEHYGRLIDLFGRTNHLDDAVVVVKVMPFEPNLAVWKTVLGSC